MTTPATKTVCLRAFNADLSKDDPWKLNAPAPPPVPKRMAWPGGKILSNKDEALAGFLRRKLDSGETLTPEQMAMLKKVTGSGDSSIQPTATSITAKKRVRRAVDNCDGDHSPNAVHARTLLRKLEAKVAQDPEPNDFSGNEDQSSIHLYRRTVDLSFLKRSRVVGGGSATPQVRSLHAISRTGAAGGVKRRVLSDGQGGFKIDALPDVNSKGKRTKRPRRDFDSDDWAKNESRTTAAKEDAIYPAAVPELYREAWAPSQGSGTKESKRSSHKSMVFSKQKGAKKAFKSTTVRAPSVAMACGRSVGQRSLEDMISGGLTTSRR